MQVRPVGAAALSLLDSFRPAKAKPQDFVFPGDGKSGHFVGLPKAWTRIAAAADVENVSIHGLRHWFASAATEMGYSELIIAPLLGHSGRGITSRYANAPDTALGAAPHPQIGKESSGLGRLLIPRAEPPVFFQRRRAPYKMKLRTGG